MSTVKYGRTVELGTFGRGPTGKAWFSWELDLDEQHPTHESMLEYIKGLADIEEVRAHDEFEAKYPKSCRSLPRKKITQKEIDELEEEVRALMRTEAPKLAAEEER